MKDYNYIAIEGNIGSGKTSLARKIATDHNAKLVLEEFEENPFLPKFYEDPDRFSFQVELSFLADRYNQLKKKIANQDLFKNFTISDYMLNKSLIFSRITLQEEEFQLYSRLFNIMYSSLPKPDLLVYLYIHPDRLQQNIKKRGRAYEQYITNDYLNQIHEGYFDFFKQQSELSILILDTNKIDFVNNQGDYEKIITALSKRYKKGINRLLL